MQLVDPPPRTLAHIEYRHARVHIGKWIILAAKMMNLQPQNDTERFICTLSANWTHTHISLDLFNIPCSYWTSTILPSVVLGSGGCLSIYVLLLWGVVSVQEGTAHQITSGCPHGITHPSLPTHVRTCINIHIPMLPPLPPSPKRWHTAVIAQNKMPCQGRKITQ